MTDEQVQISIDLVNSRLQKEEQEEFTRKKGEELKTRCHELTREVAKRYDSIILGEAPRAFGEYDRDDIARILNTDMTIEYLGYDLDMTPGKEVGDDWREGAIESLQIFAPEEAWDRSAFVGAFDKYLYTAAAFAKSIGALHAMRLYLRAWGIVHEVYVDCDVCLALSPDEALRVVRLERIASSRLWLDVEAAKLPKFKPRKPRAPIGKTAKASKKRKGRG